MHTGDLTARCAQLHDDESDSHAVSVSLIDDTLAAMPTATLCTLPHSSYFSLPLQTVPSCLFPSYFRSIILKVFFCVTYRWMWVATCSCQSVSHLAAVTSQDMELSVTWCHKSSHGYKSGHGAVSHVVGVTSQVSESERRENTTSDE